MVLQSGKVRGRNSGRGPIEAAGVGMEVKPTDIALRCNFATVDENLLVKDRRAGRVVEGREELTAAINGINIEGCKFLFKTLPDGVRGSSSINSISLGTLNLANLSIQWSIIASAVRLEPGFNTTYALGTSNHFG